jgi:hypothetical protein
MYDKVGDFKKEDREAKKERKAVAAAAATDVYTRFCSCRQCWASKCRGL